MTSFIPGFYYVCDGYGNKMAGGKDFATIEAGIEAAKTVVRRRNSNKRAHGDTAYDVVQAIPGRHRIRATVSPDLTVDLRD